MSMRLRSAWRLMAATKRCVIGAISTDDGTRIRELTKLKTAAFAPIPIPSVKTTIRAKPGFLRSPRTANRRSRTIESSIGNPARSLSDSLICVTPPNFARANRRASAGDMQARRLTTVQ